MSDENKTANESTSYRFTPENPVFEARSPVRPSEDEPAGEPRHAAPQHEPTREESPYEAPRYEPTREEPRYEAPRYEPPRYEPPRYEPPHPEPPRYGESGKKKKGWTAGKLIALALVCALIGGCFGAGGLYLLTRNDKKTVTDRDTTQLLQGERELEEIETVAIDSSRLLTASEVYAANVNSTVGISTSITTTNFWGFATTGAASGSGFIISADGYILTNQHVIEDSDSITVTTYDGTEYDAKLIGYDESNDVAVVKVDAQGLTPVVFGDSDNLNVGDGVVAIGNPLGELTFSLTYGVVSALDRTVTFSSGVQMNLIQTDCAINSGNSGGPLFNMYGEVVGITNSKYGSSGSSSIDNIAFAVPIDKARTIAESLIEKGYIAKPFIGVSTVTVSEEMQSYGFPKGAAIKEVVEGAPAESAGLQVNDIITAVNGEAITSSGELSTAISRHSPGDVLTLSVFRQGEDNLLSIEITVGEKQQAAMEEDEIETGQQQQQGSSGQQGSPYYYYSNPFSSDPFGFFGFGG